VFTRLQCLDKIGVGVVEVDLRNVSQKVHEALAVRMLDKAPDGRIVTFWRAWRGK
jgi:hypothetical protein